MPEHCVCGHSPGHHPSTLRGRCTWVHCPCVAYRPVPAPAPLGWWVISGDALLDALRRAHAGENPDLLYAEIYANVVKQEQVEGDDDGR